MTSIATSPNKTDASPASGPPNPPSIFRERPRQYPERQGWQTRLRRQGLTISRSFRDSVYGSPEAALDQAIAWRDAVLAAIPPTTNHEAATRLRKTNRSGISGVARRDTPGQEVWFATLLTRDGQKRATFAIRDYGEEGAKARAIAQRQAWLDALPPRYLSMNDLGCERTAAYFGDTIPRATSVFEHTALPQEEIKARLAAINARFDALRPARVRLRVQLYSAERLSIAVSDAGWPARRKLLHVACKTRPLAKALDMARDKIRAQITTLHGSEAADWFMHHHANALMDPDQFDPKKGVNICKILPDDRGKSAERSEELPQSL